VVIGGITAIPRPLTRKAVYLVRDPRDICVSFSRHLGQSIDETIRGMADMNNVLASHSMGSWLTSWSNHVETWDRDFVTIIRYEDLKSNPEESFTKILETFGITVDQDKVRKAIELCDISRLRKQESEEDFIEIGNQDKFFGQGKGWKTELTSEQAKRVESDHKVMMEQYGYIT